MPRWLGDVENIINDIFRLDMCLNNLSYDLNTTFYLNRHFQSKSLHFLHWDPIYDKKNSYFYTLTKFLIKHRIVPNSKTVEVTKVLLVISYYIFP